MFYNVFCALFNYKSKGCEDLSITSNSGGIIIEIINISAKIQAAHNYTHRILTHSRHFFWEMDNQEIIVDHLA